MGGGKSVKGSGKAAKGKGKNRGQWIEGHYADDKTKKEWQCINCDCTAAINVQPNREWRDKCYSCHQDKGWCLSPGILHTVQWAMKDQQDQKIGKWANGPPSAGKSEESAKGKGKGVKGKGKSQEPDKEAGASSVAVVDVPVQLLKLGFHKTLPIPTVEKIQSIFPIPTGNLPAAKTSEELCSTADDLKTAQKELEERNEDLKEEQNRSKGPRDAQITLAMKLIADKEVAIAALSKKMGTPQRARTKLTNAMEKIPEDQRAADKSHQYGAQMSKGKLEVMIVFLEAQEAQIKNVK